MGRSSTGDYRLSDEKMKLSSRLLIGGIAGFAATLAMTAAMRRLHERLPAKEDYPLTPREIVDSSAAQADLPVANETSRDVTTAAHFAYGALMGAIIAALNPDPGKRTGTAAGLAVWVASYMGWIPAVGILEPATKHPPRRNLLMIASHLVWGYSTAVALRELKSARRQIFDRGKAKDAPPEGQRPV